MVAHNEYRLLRKATQEGVFKPLIDRGITADWFTQPNMAVVAKFASGQSEFFVKPSVISAGDNESRPKQDDGLRSKGVRHYPDGYAVQLLGVV